MLLRAVAPATFAAAAAMAAAVFVLAGVTVPAAALSIVATGAAILAAVSAHRLAEAGRRINDASRDVLAGDLSARANPLPGDPATAAFNQMTQYVQEVIEAAGQERGRLVAALDSIGDAVVAVDAQGSVVFANTAARQLGAPGAVIEGNPFVWMFPDEQVVSALRASREDGARETRLVERPGKQFFHVTTTPIVRGGDWAALAVFHDLTDVRRVEQVRRDFVANVSHELRTPLAAVKSVIETLQSGALDDPEVALDFLNRADAEVDRLVRMVEELLELSRIESGEAPVSSESVNIGELVNDATRRLRPQAEKQRLRLEVEVSERLPAVTGDAEHLERVIVNLVHNALKFTPPGGSIRVEAGTVNGAVRIAVSDTGDGILPEDLPRVFERFYKADRAREGGGTGLGLAVAKHTVEAHGGSIQAESAPGKGSTFTVLLPAEGNVSVES